jgi:hypothetical protein
MLVGSAYMLPRLWRKWKQDSPLAKTIGAWIIISALLGVYATLPSILRRISVDSEWITSWWVNVFLFYPLIEKLNSPSIVLGELCTALTFATQYTIILLAIFRCIKKGNSAV